MEAIVLCGGKGTRIQSVLSDIPKVLAPTRGGVLLDLTVDRLVKKGPVNKIILATGYLSEKIEDYLEKELSQKYKDAEFIVSREPEELGTGGAIKLAGQHIQGDHFFAMNGDVLMDLSHLDFLDFHHSRGSALSLVLKEKENKDYGSVALDSEGRIVEFVEKSPKAEKVLVSAGHYIMRKELLSMMPEGNFSLEYDFFPKVIAEKNCYGHVVEEDFLDIGTPERYSTII